MKFKSDNSFLFVEGIQFINGLYITTNKKEIEILKKYPDRVTVVEEEVKEDITETPKETEPDTTEVTTDTTKTTKKK